MQDKVYIVYSFGGEYEDKWNHIECAFLTKEEADKWIEDEEAKKNIISDELFYEIREWIGEREYDITEEFFKDGNPEKMIPGKTKEEYYAALDKFSEEQYDMAAEHFNVDADVLRQKEHDVDYDFVGYHCKEVPLIVGKQVE